MDVEVFADISCPFTHVGLKRVVEHVRALPHGVRIHVRAWPLEWVNGEPLAVEAVEAKAAALTEQLGVDDFPGIDREHWPSTTIPALNLAAAGYAVDSERGLAVSMALRAALFEQGRNVGDPDVLEGIARAHGLPAPEAEASAAVVADFDDGRRRGVTGSPHFWVGQNDFFCPALDLGHDDEGKLTARLDVDGLRRFFERVDSADP